MLAGRYELVRFVGRGGMGEVWEARDRLIERRVAVKLLPHARSDASGAALFFREARTAGALHHPGVVTVHDLGEDEADGTLFLVMEYLEGRDLAAVLAATGPPPVRTAGEWAAQAAEALARAHGAGIVHRDLKPANLMLTDEGRIKILDFGIARFVAASAPSSNVMGTLAYMPPERLDEQPGDARSDLYSLGCVVHELLTGQVPFQASGPVAMINAHLRATPKRPGELRGGVPAELDELVLALLEKEPRDRPASADEVCRRLRAAVGLPLEGSAASALPPVSVSQTVPAASARSRAAGRDAGPDAERNADRVAGPDAGAGRPAAPRSPRDPGSKSAVRRRALWLAAAAVAAGGISAVLELVDSPDERKGQSGDGSQTLPSQSGVGRATVKKPWAFSTSDEVSSSPVVVNRVVYIGSDDKYVYAIDVATGLARWTFPTSGKVTTAPVAADGIVYVGSGDGNVYALDAATGARRWAYAVGAEVGSSPAVADRVVYVAGWDNGLHALDAATGTKKWVQPIGNNLGSAPAVAGGVVYIGSWDKNVYALNAATGATKWTFRTGAEVSSSPVVADGVVYVGSDDSNVYALDAATGAKKWAFATGDKVNSSPAVAGGLVYFGSRDDTVYAVDAATGVKKWTFRTAESRFPAAGAYSSPEVAGGVVYIGSRDMNVYALDAATGAKKWAYTTGHLVGSSPAVADGMVYVGSRDRKIYALDAATGAGPA
ncbi:outer membrane protein assembly factor BamB family protein [Yinghuangia soli]|uniref:outer membrane protein assembly factor BamB family protein n=1 Tax=Yinghuangia soli TaxID=2908204 RepID=UPI001F19276E|nr:PQQ-binding-like beta-propeller repeat protein [Yinghuangia soli]